MNTKTIGIILVVIGIVMMAYTGFNIVTEKHVTTIGPVEINQQEDHPVYWSPIVGGVVLLGGIVVLVAGNKNGKA